MPLAASVGQLHALRRLSVSFGLLALVLHLPCAAAIAKQLHARRLPVDKEGIYVVLTSPDMHIEGVCSDYCGWHDKEYHGDTMLAYSLVADASKCPNSCGFNAT